MEKQVDPNGANARGKGILVAVIATVVLVVGFVLFLVGKDSLVSSPTEARARAADVYERLMQPAEPAPELRGDFLESQEVEETDTSLSFIGQGLTIDHQPPRVEGRLLDYELVRVPVGGAYEFKGGTIGLVAQGIGYGVIPKGSRIFFGHQVPARFFSPAGEPLTGSSLTGILGDSPRTIHFDGDFPGVRFVFGSKNDQGPWMVLGFHFLDPVTKANLTDSHMISNGESGSLPFVEFSAQRWHAGPVELVVDVAHGPVKEIEIEARAGEVIRHGQWELHLAAVKDWGLISTSYGIERTQIDAVPSSGEPSATYVFLGNPCAYRLPVILEGIDSAGSAVPLQKRGWSNVHLAMSAHVNPPDIKRIRAKVYTEVRRLVFELPGIHGLPPGNEQVANLFDVRIPYVMVADQWDLEELVAKAVQFPLRRERPNATFPSGFFPRSYTNASPREILGEYLDQLPGGSGSASVDAEAQELEIDGPNVATRFWDRLVSWFR